MKFDRYSIAKTIQDVTPAPPEQGPPLPEGFNVTWPNMVTKKLIDLEIATATGPRIKTLVIGKIAGWS